jgi:predicted transcriptional regulator
MRVGDKEVEYDSAGKTGSASLLNKVLGTSNKTKIVAVLVTKDQRDLCVREIANLAGIDRTAAYDPLKELVEIGLVNETRVVSNSQMYQINRNSESARLIAELQFALAEEFSDRIHELEEPAA